ncbi:MAG: hypothetical protein R2851_23615 [Caldilineaceae bacterium]
MIRRLTMDQLRRYICDRNPDPGQFPAQRPVATDLAGANYRMVTLRELFDFVARYGAAPRRRRTNAFRLRRCSSTWRLSASPTTRRPSATISTANIPGSSSARWWH